VTNSTLSGNSSYFGGGIYVYNGTLTLYNTIVAQNTAQTSPDIHRQSGTIQGFNNLTTYFGDEFNFFYDPDLPLFVDAENGDYRLTPGSQAIDKGKNEYAYNAGLDENSLDMAGKPRFTGMSIDIGAYEFPVPFIMSQSQVYQGNVTFQWDMAEDAKTMRLTWISGTTTTVLGIFNKGGSYLWDTTRFADAPGVLKVEYFDEKNQLVTGANYVATIINDPNIVIHRGEITGSETWAKDKVHLVVGRLDLKNGATLTVAEGTIVKFWKGAYINVNTGTTLLTLTKILDLASKRSIF